jgi:sigma-54 dependent transcriptional regulator, flagellar regulatory protein
MAVVQFRNAFGIADSADGRNVDPETFRCLVGRSPGIDAVRRFIEHVSANDSNAMLLGETGTGKRVAASSIHYWSSRRAAPFITVDCRAAPPTLHEVASARGGTLFLDEVGDMDLDMQSAFVRRVRSNVRIVSTCHRDLRAMIAEGMFRKDLFDNLAVASITMPSLRERREDIPLLISEIKARLLRRGLRPKPISDSALRAMLAYDWPGNVRELSRLIERCAYLAEGASIDIDKLPQRIRGTARATEAELRVTTARVSGGSQMARLDIERIELRGLLHLLETRLIRQALDRSNGDAASAARQLGLRQTTFDEKMRNCGIAQPLDGSAEA